MSSLPARAATAPRLPFDLRGAMGFAGLAFAAMALLSLGSCGGGVGSGGTGSFASGTIGGFGSVIVNDVRFDEGAATVVDGDGVAKARSDLVLGMTVEVDAEAIAGGSARANRIRYDSALLGPVEQVDANGFTVLGQRVASDETTVYDTALPGGLAALSRGQIVEVFAVTDVTAPRYRATRVQLRAAGPVYRIRGQVSNVESNNQTLRIGTASFSYSGAGGVPANIAPGQFVRLTLGTTQGQGQRWPIVAFSEAVRPLTDLDDVRLKGLITAFGSATAFQVEGRPVDAAGARVEGQGGAAALAPGVRVQVEGPLRDGVLRARSVTIRSDNDERDRGFELRGPIEAVDVGQRTLVLRGLQVGWGRPNVQFENGSAANLVPGRVIEIRGPLGPSRNGIEAFRITFF